MAKFVINVKDATYLKALEAWAISAKLPYDIVEDVTLPPFPTSASDMTNSNISNATLQASAHVAPTAKAEKVWKPIQKHIDNISYEVREVKDMNSGKTYNIIAFIKPEGSGKTVADLKKQINDGIKAIPKITTVQVAKEGGGHFKAWGFTKAETAEKHIPELATSFDYVEMTSK